MEGYVLGCGNIPCLREWEQDLRGVKLPWTYKKGKKKVLFRVIVGEVKLYKIVFPKEHLDVMMGMIGVDKDGSYILRRYKSINRIVKMFRKVLGLKAAPNPTKIIEHMQPNQSSKAVGIIPLGIKEDALDDNGIEML